MFKVIKFFKIKLNKSLSIWKEKNKHFFYGTPNFSATDATMLITVKPKILRLVSFDFRLSFIQTTDPRTTYHLSINYLLIETTASYYLKMMYYLEIRFEFSEFCL